MVIEKRLCYCVIAFILLVLGYFYVDLKRVWYKLLLHTFYIACDLLKLLVKLVELY